MMRGGENYSFRMRLAAVVAILAVVVGQLATAELQCSDAVSLVIPCEAYLLGGDGSPNGACCSAIQSLDKIAAASQTDRRAICHCFKDTAKSFPINLAKAQRLPPLCHVNINVAVNPNIDCDSI